MINWLAIIKRRKSEIHRIDEFGIVFGVDRIARYRLFAEMKKLLPPRPFL